MVQSTIPKNLAYEEEVVVVDRAAAANGTGMSLSA